MRLFILVLILFLGSAANATRFWGPAQSIGKGWARSYVDIDQKKLKAIGAAISHNAFHYLPQSDTTYILTMPHVIDVAPFQYVMLNWNPHGHEPIPIYQAAHFDFHFYLLSPKETLAIDCGPIDDKCLKMPGAAYIPKDYVPTPAGVPQMGWHWVDKFSPELNGKPFTKTFLYGFYDGALAFLEPMITLDFLLLQKNTIIPVKQPTSYVEHGSYPKAYSVEFNAKGKYHSVAIRNFKTW